jgi:hypothetical protein
MASIARHDATVTIVPSHAHRYSIPDGGVKRIRLLVSSCKRAYSGTKLHQAGWSKTIAASHVLLLSISPNDTQLGDNTQHRYS